MKAIRKLYYIYKIQFASDRQHGVNTVQVYNDFAL